MTTGVLTAQPSQRESERLRSAEAAENFPVALRVLPRTLRRDLAAVYDVLRTIDDLGDVAEGDRTALLLAFRADLARVWTDGRPEAAVLQRLVPTARARRLPQREFDRLIEANLQDQTVTEYATFEQLRDYCRLSADPVGHLVLHLFGQYDDAAARLSDSVCTALQLLEHWQDVGEDRQAGRVYLPREDREAFGVAPDDLDASEASPALRRLLAFEVRRAEALLDEGSLLVGQLSGWARPAVAGYIAGGTAAAAALRRSNFDVLPAAPRPRGRDVLTHLASQLVRSVPEPRRPSVTTPPTASGIDDAYTACEDITRTEARNFYYGIRLLPKEKRAVLCAVYALARRIDDIGDGNELPTEVKLKQLADLRTALEDAAAGRPDASDPVLSAVVDAERRYPIPLDAFGELIDGVEMDIRMDAGGAGYGTFGDLVLYCRCVAGSVGRLCLGVFGSRPDPQAEAYADSLGIALQQTNILRDIREDLTNGRVYLPTEELDRFGVHLELDAADRLVDPDGNLERYIRFAAERAEGWYADGLRLVPLLDRRSAACCTAMSGIYSALLRRIGAEPTLVFDRRLSLSGREKAIVAARALAGRAA